MKKVTLLITIIIIFSCNNSDRKNNGEPLNKETNSDIKKDETKGNVKNKEDFMLTCAVDASNSLGGENQEKVKQFCECAWEKSKGEYRGQVIATESKLKKDSILKDCYEQAKK